MPQGLLGPIKTIPRAGQLNALSTLNLRPATRKAWVSMTTTRAATPI